MNLKNMISKYFLSQFWNVEITKIVTSNKSADYLIKLRCPLIIFLSSICGVLNDIK
jgi:hypothetical protein